MFSPAGHAWLHGGMELTYTGSCSRTGPVPDDRLKSGGNVMSVRSIDIVVRVPDLKNEKNSEYEIGV